jgi:hypothetical protein
MRLTLIRRGKFVYIGAFTAISMFAASFARADLVAGQRVAITNNDTALRTVTSAVVTLLPDVSQPSFRRVNDPNVGTVDEGFTAPAAGTTFPVPNFTVIPNIPRTRSVTFRGGNLVVGDTDTVNFDFLRPFGPPGADSIPIRFKTRLATFGRAIVPDAPLFPRDVARATSVGNDMFSKSVDGGTIGTLFLGVPIPANEYGYFYQFNAQPGASPDSFVIEMGGSSPTSSGVIANSWSQSALSADLGAEVQMDVGPAALSITDSMNALALTGSPGANPLSWAFNNGAMVATFAPQSFGSSAPSAILWFTSPTPPSLGGPLGIDGDNGMLWQAGNLVSSGGVVSPVPEPHGIAMIFAAAAIFTSWSRLHRRASRG